MSQVEIKISDLGVTARHLTKDESSFQTCCVALDTRLEEIVKHRKFADVKVFVGEQDFHCHWLVLRSYSEYFDQTAKSDMVDHQMVQLPTSHVTPDAFELVYEWILNDAPVIKRSHFVEVFKAAKFLKIEELSKQCMSIIDDIHLIGEREALTMYLEAIEFDEPFLRDVMMTKLKKIFLTFVASSEFAELSFEHVQDLFTSNCIAVNSELDLFFTAISWIDHDLETRRQHVIPLMHFVRFELMESWQLVELKNCPAGLEEFLNHEEIMLLIDEALAVVALNKSNHDFGDSLRIPRVKHRQKLDNDARWKHYEFETNPNFFENYQNFCKYLQDISHKDLQDLVLVETRRVE